MNIEDILNSLTRTSVRTPSPGQYDGYQYFWGNHPEKDATSKERYDTFGAQADPLGGEIGRESGGYMTGPNYMRERQGTPWDEYINRLPAKFRQQYLSLLGGVNPNFDQGSWQ